MKRESLVLERKFKSSIIIICHLLEEKEEHEISDGCPENISEGLNKHPLHLAPDHVDDEEDHGDDEEDHGDNEEDHVDNEEDGDDKKPIYWRRSAQEALPVGLT